MADNEKDEGVTQPPATPEPKKVQVDESVLAKILEGQAETERKLADMEAKNAGLEEMIAAGQGANALGEPKIREKKSFEPKFRTVRLRKYPIAGDYDNQGIVIGWTDRGAYQEVDRSGVTPQVVDYMDIFFLNHDRTPDGKLKAEKVRLLDLLNKGAQIHCKILETKKEQKIVPTGEEIDVTVWDPQHGLIQTGDKIDGYYAYSDITYKLEIPGVGVVEVDGEFVN